MSNRVRRVRVAAGALLLLSCALCACALPWGKSAAKLDPRDGAFAPVTVAPLQGGVQWGVPLAGGPLRVLFIAPRFALRDAAELAHRLEMRIETVALWDATHLGRPDSFPREIPGTSADDVLKDLHDKLDKKLDVIIAANFDFSVLPPEDFAALADKVRGGTGLVLAHHRHTLPDTLKAFLDELTPDAGGAIVTHGLGESMTAEWMTGLGFVQCGTIGEGRVVEIDYQGEWPLTHALIPALTNPLVAEREDFDTYLSLAARAVRWAGGYDVPVTVTSIRAKPAPGPEEVQIPPGLEEMEAANAPAGASMIHPYQLELTAPADRTYTVRTGVRQRGRGQPPVTNILTRDPLRKGSQSYDFYILSGAGDYWLDVWLLDGEKVVEWYSDIVKIDSWPSIGDLALNKTSVLPQDSVGITFTMPALKRPCIAYVRATDALGRVVADRHQPIPPDTALVQMGLGLADLVSDMLKIELFVSDRDLPFMPDWDMRTGAYAYKYLPVRGNAPTDTFTVVTDVAGGVEYNEHAVYRGLRQAGFDTATFPATEESMRLVTALGLHALPQVTSYFPYQTPPSAVRSPCLTAPDFIVSEQTHLKSMGQVVRDYGTTAISLGEGNALSTAGEDLCKSPSCVLGFGEYLHKVYGNLETLNRVWQTSLDTWNGIVPPTEEQARESKRYAPWIDFRLFMDSVFLNTHTAARALMRTADTRSRSGIAVASEDELFTGGDWSALSSHLDMMVTPPNVRAVEIARSGRPTFAFTGVAAPPNATVDTLRWLPWYAVLHRAQSVWWPDVTASTVAVPNAVALDPLGAPVPFAPEFAAESTALIDGLARLWLKATPARAEIAIYTGRASAWLNHIDNQFVTSSAESEGAFAAALCSLGYPFDFIWKEKIEKGGLSAYHVLVLPMARALSDAEVAAVREFAASGGCVIADVAPGAFDEHGVPRAAPPLAVAFGVQYAKASSASGASSALVELTIENAKASGDFTDIRVDVAVGPTDAQVGGLAGTVPVWLLRTGEMKSLLLNHAVHEHALDRAHGMLGDVLRVAGVQRPVDVEVRKGTEFEGERFLATYGKAGLVALLARPDAAANRQKLRLKFDRSAQVYDLRTGLPVRRPAKIDVELPRGGIALYSVLPYSITSCLVTVPPLSMPGTRLPVHVSLETGGGAAANHLVRVDVVAVTNEGLVPLRHYGQEIVCANGEGDGYVPFALNDPITRYKIVARDLLTGVSGEAFVNLSSAKRN